MYVDSVCIDWRRSRIIVAPIRNPGEDIGDQSQRCPVQRGSRPRRGEFQEGRARQGRRQGHDGISGQRQSDSRKNGAIEGASPGQRGGREGAQRLTGDGDPLLWALKRTHLWSICYARPYRPAASRVYGTPLNASCFKRLLARSSLVHWQPRSRGVSCFHPQKAVAALKRSGRANAHIRKPLH